jgi:hypothetical protein
MENERCMTVVLFFARDVVQLVQFDLQLQVVISPVDAEIYRSISNLT